MMTVSGKSFYGTGPGLSSFQTQSLKDLVIPGSTAYTSFDIPGGLATGHIGTISNSQITFQSLRNSTFTGGSVTESTFNLSGSVGTPLNLNLLGVKDSFINDTGYLRSLKLSDMLNTSYGNATAPGSGGIYADSIGSIQVGGDFKTDFKLTPSLGLKYSLGSFTSNGLGYGNWNIGGSAHYLSFKSIDSGFAGTFDHIDGLNIAGTYSGSITSGSIGGASFGNMTSGELWTTTSWSANSWDLGALKVGHEIESSQIRSNGNIGSISTMFSYSSWIGAGMSPGYVFGQPLTSGDFASPAIIKSIYIDCPNKSYYHFDGGYVGAYNIQNAMLGNVQTNYYGLPEGFATNLLGKLQAGVAKKTLRLSDVKSTFDLAAQLQASGITSSDLGDLKFLLDQ